MPVGPQLLKNVTCDRPCSLFPIPCSLAFSGTCQPHIAYTENGDFLTAINI
jgi:hypothetical protein